MDPNQLQDLIVAAQTQTADVATAAQTLTAANAELADAQAVVAQRQIAANEARIALGGEREEAITAWTAVQTAIAEIIAGLRG